MMEGDKALKKFQASEEERKGYQDNPNARKKKAVA